MIPINEQKIIVSTIIMILTVITLIIAPLVNDPYLPNSGKNNVIKMTICNNCTYITNNVTGTGSMDYTNIALTNQSNIFEGNITAENITAIGNLRVTKNITIAQGFLRSDNGIGIGTNPTSSYLLYLSKSVTNATTNNYPVFISPTISSGTSSGQYFMPLRVFGTITGNNNFGGYAYGIAGEMRIDLNQNKTVNVVEGLNFVTTISSNKSIVVNDARGMVTGVSSDIARAIANITSARGIYVANIHNTTGKVRLNEDYGIDIVQYPGGLNTTDKYGIYIHERNGQVGRFINNYGIYLEYMNGSSKSWQFYSEQGNSHMGGDDDKIYFGTHNDASISDDGTNLVLISNETGGSGIVWVSGNMSVGGIFTRSKTYDKSKGKALDWVHDTDYYKKQDGTINHTAFYGSTAYEVTDYSRPEKEYYQKEVCDEVIKIACNDTGGDCFNYIEKENCKNNTMTRTVYPYKVMEEGIDLEEEINVLRQSVYELKKELCLAKPNTYSFCGEFL